MSNQRPIAESDSAVLSAKPPVTGPLVTSGIDKATSAGSQGVEKLASVPEAKDGGSSVEQNPLPEFVHQYLRHYISLADQKAGFVFAAVSAILAFLISKSGLSTFKTILDSSAKLKAGDFVPLLASATLISAAVLAIWVVAPRLRVKAHSSKGLIFWQDICTFPNAEEYSAEVQKLDAEEAAGHIRLHCYTLAHVCDRKYHKLMWAIWLGALGFFLTVLAILFCK